MIEFTEIVDIVDVYHQFREKFLISYDFTDNWLIDVKSFFD